MQLPGDRVRLREFGGEDAADFESYHTNSRFLRFYGPEARDREHLRGLVERFISWAGVEPRRNYQLAIADSATGQLIGCCGLRTAGLPEKCADFGLELSADRWGRGLATEASGLLLAFGFGSLGLEEVRATSVTENTDGREGVDVDRLVALAPGLAPSADRPRRPAGMPARSYLLSPRAGGAGSVGRRRPRTPRTLDRLDGRPRNLPYWPGWLRFHSAFQPKGQRRT